MWFTPGVPIVHPNDLLKSFSNSGGGSTLLAPGQYAVVGPRPLTYVGTSNNGSAGAIQQFALTVGTPGTFSYTPSSAVNVAATNPPQQAILPAMNSALPIVCSFSQPAVVWPYPIGLSVSEPLPSAAYYQTPTDPGPTGLTDTYNPPIDFPQDGSNFSAGGVMNAPLTMDGLFQTQTVQNYKTALLQRLANPLQAHDPALNPYITVDWLPIDLVVFNGQATTPPTDPDDAGALAGFSCGGLERGFSPGGGAYSNLWSNYPQTNTNVTALSAGSGDVFGYNLQQSLGYLNRTMGVGWLISGNTPPATTPPTYAYGNAPYPSANVQPFSWLNWNNRPFNNGLELLLVPPNSAEQMLRNFLTPPAQSPYIFANNDMYLPYRHLLNFFLSSNAATNGQAPYFYRLLDYVGVPSRFVGTDTVLNPVPLSSGGFPSPQMVSTFGPGEQQMACYLHPPFNSVSNYREPGRVNINTIPTQNSALSVSPVWLALVNGALSPSNGTQLPNWSEITDSRRGLLTYSGVKVSAQNSSYPSIFTNPFRSAGGAAYHLPGDPNWGTPQPEINVTLLRPSLNNNILPLLGPDANYGGYNNAGYNYANQHPYFRYQNLMRLNNLLTTRSNVYAVWVTMGYFEVSPWDAPPQDGIPDIDVAHPDGWQLGAELGSDTGDIHRHRAFYIIDRSIPVGYEPGRNHNLDDATLVKRYIE